MDYIEVIGFVAAVLTTAAFLPQVYKTWQTKDVSGVSLTMFITMFTGVILWLVYGLFINSLPMLVANTISAILIFTVIVLKIKHHKK
ncbi:SemiSWEET transporter [Flavivirga aquimarina]|uniref:SemiSWEET transporter n=1 Tax=Flavivirga aquimarina TaxID=2027862 RepID=A0ABT8WH49_9FLAO|nr:SemiSWEET transporter [Flavivirga aquimarina]MDO5972383.1 SemiSWEET transporter [Flavivirga aquimarina]